ncbi:MAG TPA: hypothetical protein VFN11_13215 [Ktedonobacterales bacterium]|nr:hypothetical protein [Ktedonobacterales bacterium]
MEQERFGDILRSFIGHASVRDLAKAINVDFSQVYRWMRNERIPHLNTDHVGKIASHLHLEARETQRLVQAQVYSLSHSQPGPTRKRSSQSRSEVVGRFMEQTYNRPEPSSPGAVGLRLASKEALPETVCESGAIVALATKLIANEWPDPSDPTIVISTQGEDLFAGLASAPELEQRWQRALRLALHHGWKIEHLWRLDRDIARSLHIVQSILELVEAGGYFPRYFDRYKLLRHPYDMVIIPRRAALLLLATNNAVSADGAVVLTEPAQIALMNAHYQQLREDSNPLFRTFLGEAQEVQFTLAMVESEANPGGRLSAMNGLSALTHPPSWNSRYGLVGTNAQQSGIVSEADMPRYIAALQRRVVAFEANIQVYDYLDICTMKGIRRLADDGRIHPHVPFVDKNYGMERRLEHIERLIFLLRNYEHYHLALLDDHEEQAIRNKPSYIITGDGHVFITGVSYDVPDKPTNMQVEVTEATIASAFREYFFETWERIAPPNKEKSSVIEWLTRQADAVRQHIRSGA